MWSLISGNRGFMPVVGPLTPTLAAPKPNLYISVQPLPPLATTDYPLAPDEPSLSQYQCEQAQKYTHEFTLIKLW